MLSELGGVGSKLKINSKFKQFQGEFMLIKSGKEILFFRNYVLPHFIVYYDFLGGIGTLWKFVCVYEIYTKYKKSLNINILGLEYWNNDREKSENSLDGIEDSNVQFYLFILNSGNSVYINRIVSFFIFSCF